MGSVGEANRNESLKSVWDALPKARREVLTMVAGNEPLGLTRHQLAAILKRPLSSICGRVNELEKAGIIVETSEVRVTEFGGRATVVRLAERLRQDKPKQLDLFS